MKFVRITPEQQTRLKATCIVVLSLCLVAVALTADGTYVVRRYDTLTAIARDHGVSVAELADFNGIPRDTKVKVGQRLRLPPGDEAKAPEKRATLPAAIQTGIDQARVTKGRWKYIVIHHSGTHDGSPAGMDRYHREVRHMENGLAYHFVIGNGHGMSDGQVAIGRRWKSQLDGGHLASEALNKVAIGICLVGNYDKEAPTAKQLASLQALIDALLKRCSLPRSAVKTHQQINPIYTRCPGRNFPSARIGKDVQPWRPEKR